MQSITETNVNKKNIMFNLWFAFVSFYICFGHLIMDDNYLYLLMDILLVIVIFSYNLLGIKKKICRFLIPLLLIIADMFVSCTYAKSFIDALKFTIVYMNFFLIAFLFVQMKGWQRAFYRWLIIGLVVHLLFTFFCIFFTDIGLNISQHILSPDIQNITARWALELNKYAGISGQLGMNAYFFCLFIGIVYADAWKTKNNTGFKMLLMFVISIAMFYTGKKGMILASLLSMLITFYIAGGRKNRVTIIRILTIMSIALGVVCIVIFGDLYELFYNSVYTRIRIYDGVIDAIKKAPILGHGINSVTLFTYEGHLAHNVFLQMWAEQGIIGLLLLLLLLSYMLYVTCQKAKNIGDYSSEAKKDIIFSVYYQIFFIIYGFTDSAFYNYPVFMIYIFSIIIPFISDSKMRKTNNEMLYNSNE